MFGCMGFEDIRCVTAGGTASLQELAGPAIAAATGAAVAMTETF
jgi:hypothetical protein